MSFPAAHGGTLIDCYLQDQALADARARLASLPRLDLTARQLCDFDLIANGAFSPLDGFLGEADYRSVLTSMRLVNGVLWPMPITLDVSEAVAEAALTAGGLVLTDAEGVPVGILEAPSAYRPDRHEEAMHVFGTTDLRHPAVAQLLERSQPVYLGGRILALQTPLHYDFRRLRQTPRELRAEFERQGFTRVVAFQTRNPMHRAHFELTRRAAEAIDGALLIHPVVGLTKPGDIDHYTRVRCYEKLLAQYPGHHTVLSLLNLAMRMGGPREALWHALIRRNHGCTHFIVGRDHAGPGNDSQGKPFYGPYDAQELVRQFADEIGITMVPFLEMVYVAERQDYAPIDEVKPGETVLNISGTEMRRLLQNGEPIPEWFTFPEVAAELQRTHPPRAHQGFTVFFTGLSGAGKSTIANALMVSLLERGGRAVTLLDGDLVRKHLSSELGFSREHRSLNVSRIGFVASEITKNGGVAVCAPIAPYAESRLAARQMVEAYGPFIEVHVSTSLEVCESRDRKGLYALARAGKIKEFTGISDPYEVPEHPELRIDTAAMSQTDAVQIVLDRLVELGLLSAP
ncbi:MAG: bifunctional sulfate adenylyltransferase/adenylylsulfate kinase [Ahniella sp.]|nr:bifunctional sulfate adenylyltransferase/adenylylsulfate kinase [Ahniella sp.]